MTSTDAVRMLFHVEPNEEVLQMAPAGKDKFVIITNRRGFVVNIAAIAEEP